MSNARVLACNAGTLHLFHLARQLDRLGLLAACATSLHVRDGTYRALPKPLQRRVANRHEASLDGKIRAHPLPELAHLSLRKVGFAQAPLIAWRNRHFGRWAADRLLAGIDVVWGFDTSSLEIFEAAKARGIRCVLDVTTPHPARGNAILAAQASSQPSFGIGGGTLVPPEEVTRRAREMALADRLVAASPFVAETLTAQGESVERIRLNPYGVELDRFSQPRARRATAPVFVFVGWFSPHKGVYHLLEAWSRSGLSASGATLRLVGGDRADLPNWRAAIPAGVEILGRVSRERLPGVLAGSDAFVFPSLLEGFGRATLEAMASGLPVLTTRNAAAAVIDGENGLVLEAGDIDALAGALRRMGADPALRERMGEASARLAQAYTWDAYGGRCAAICRELARGAG
jgi:glycosyltransferase involved in cell wall biosynthesis